MAFNYLVITAMLCLLSQLNASNESVVDFCDLYSRKQQIDYNFYLITELRDEMMLIMDNKYWSLNRTDKTIHLNTNSSTSHWFNGQYIATITAIYGNRTAFAFIKPNKLTDWKTYAKNSPNITIDFEGISDRSEPMFNTTGFDKTLQFNPNFGVQVVNDDNICLIGQMQVKNVYNRDYKCYDVYNVTHVFPKKPNDDIPLNGQSGHKVIAVFNDYNSSFQRLLWLYADELEIRYCWTLTNAMSTNCFPNSTTLINCESKLPTSTSTSTTETVAKPITTSSPPVLTSLTLSPVLNESPTPNPSPGINYLVVGNVAAFLALILIFIASAITMTLGYIWREEKFITVDFV